MKYVLINAEFLGIHTETMLILPKNQQNDNDF